MALKERFLQAKKDAKVEKELASKEWTPAKIKRLIYHNDIFVERALLVLLARQTDNEVAYASVALKNMAGFATTDVKILTKLAKTVRNNINGNAPGKRLIASERDTVREHLYKYAGQLSLYANNKHIIIVQTALGVDVNNKDFAKGGVYREAEPNG